MTTIARQPLRQAEARLREAVGKHGRLGAQLFVSVHGRPLLNLAVGHYRGEEATSPDHAFSWLCSCKPVTVLAMAVLFDRGLLSTDMLVGEVLPEFAVAGKETATVEHLLTHTLVYRQQDKPELLDRASALARVCAWPVTAPPGTRAWYSAFANWLVLAEIVERLSGKDYFAFVRDEVLDPLRMTRTAFLHDSGQLPAGALFEHTGTGRPVPAQPTAYMTRWPGSGMWGPAEELARPLECVVSNGTWHGRRLISENAVGHFFTPCRVQVDDDYFDGLRLSWSRGVCTDRSLLGAPARARVAGHTGFVTSLVLGDLDEQLVVAFTTNTAVTSEPLFRRLGVQLVRDLYGLTQRT